jgi:hypothetical protein
MIAVYTFRLPMRHTAFALLVAGSAATAHADAPVVRVNGGMVDVRVTSRPLSEVLDELGRATGMKVVYEGQPPRQPIAANIEGARPVQAVLALLDGLSLPYAMKLDPTGSRVETLMMVGSGTKAATPAVAAATMPEVEVEEYVEPEPPAEDPSLAQIKEMTANGEPAEVTSFPSDFNFSAPTEGEGPPPAGANVPLPPWAQNPSQPTPVPGPPGGPMPAGFPKPPGAPTENPTE